ncbi:hypothetical protein KY363_07565, partial [Candidatus Woesearchaeota archaeon]|nr:hypothetical protein [Candidatus Woesearchaeota archaeon]
MGGAKVVHLADILSQRTNREPTPKTADFEATETSIEDYRRRIVPRPLEAFCATYGHMPCWAFSRMQLAEYHGDSRKYRKGKEYCANNCEFEARAASEWMAQMGLTVHGIRRPERLR